jgi:hypothetical protein
MAFSGFRKSFMVRVLLSALVSFLAVILVFGDELSRRLGEYSYVYYLCWCISIIGLIMPLHYIFRFYDIRKLLIVTLFVSYISTVLAYTLAVVFDVSGIRELHYLNLNDAFVISLVFPFFVLRGWVFCFLFTLFLLVLYYLGWLRKVER